MSKLSYVGTSIFGHYGLYGTTGSLIEDEVDSVEQEYSDDDTKQVEIEDVEIDMKGLKNAILERFKDDNLNEIKKTLNKVGLKYEGLDYHSPKYFNYKNDSIDLIISISDKQKLLDYIKNNESEIQELLDSNKSRDGYIALTKYNVSEIIEELEEDNNLGISVLVHLFKDLREKTGDIHYKYDIIYDVAYQFIDVKYKVKELQA